MTYEQAEAIHGNNQHINHINNQQQHYSTDSDARAQTWDIIPNQQQQHSTIHQQQKQQQLPLSQHSAVTTQQQPITQSSIVTTSQQPVSLRCTIDNVEILLDLLTTLVFRTASKKATSSNINDNKCYITIIDAGLKITIVKNLSLCGKLYIKKATFTQWIVNDSILNDYGNTYVIDIITFVKCLQIFGRDSHGRVLLAFNTPDTPISVTIEDEGSVSICQLHTYDNNDINYDITADFNFKANPYIAVCDVQSQYIKHLIQELELGNTSLTITFNPEKPRLTLKTETDGMSMC